MTRRFLIVACYFECSQIIDNGFEKLCENRWKWRLVDDVIYPWGGYRGSGVRTVWTFDFDKGVLFFEKQNEKRWLPHRSLYLRPIEESDFKSYKPVAPRTIPAHKVF